MERVRWAKVQAPVEEWVLAVPAWEWDVVVVAATGKGAGDSYLPRMNCLLWKKRKRDYWQIWRSSKPKKKPLTLKNKIDFLNPPLLYHEGAGCGMYNKTYAKTNALFL